MPCQLLTEVSLKLSAVSVPGLRMWPALVAWATVVIPAGIGRTGTQGRPGP